MLIRYTSISVHELQCMHSLSTAHFISAVCAVVVAAIAAGTTSIVSQTTTISITADHTVVTVVVTRLHLPEDINTFLSDVSKQ